MRHLRLKMVVRSFSSTSKYMKYLPEELKKLTASYLDKIEENVVLRQHNNNVQLLRELVNNLKTVCEYDTLKTELLKLPNSTHPRLREYGTEPKQIEIFEPNNYNEKATEFSEASKYMNIFRMDHLGNYTGHKSYYLFGKLAELEHAIKEYAVGHLQDNDFDIISVPDILPKSTIEGCGMQTDGERTQVYKLDSGLFLSGTSEMALAGFFENYMLEENELPLKVAAVTRCFRAKTSEKRNVYKLDSGLCLSGTSEMALAGFFENYMLEENELPLKVAAVSRCFRAETSGLTEEKGIYRVHQFTKVEMFSICSATQSEHMIECFKNLQLELFKKLGLKLRLLDMPPNELGASAYQKYDIEAWMPGRATWGEISSCSNCTDYQAKRLNIRYRTREGDIKYTHTVNGTAAAIPRLLIGLLETHQVDSNIIQVPEVVAKYMETDIISKAKFIPEIKLIKHLKNDM